MVASPAVLPGAAFPPDFPIVVPPPVDIPPVVVPPPGDIDEPDDDDDDNGDDGGDDGDDPDDEDMNPPPTELPEPATFILMALAFVAVVALFGRKTAR